MRIAPLLALALFSATAHGTTDTEVDRTVAARIDSAGTGSELIPLQGGGMFRGKRVG